MLLGRDTPPPVDTLLVNCLFVCLFDISHIMTSIETPSDNNNNNSNSNKALPRHKERHWTDAQIRWTAANHNLPTDNDDDDDDDSNTSIQEEEKSCSDSDSSAGLAGVETQDPPKIFSHSFVHPKYKNNNHKNNNHNNNSQKSMTQRTKIQIDLCGYEEESDTIYVSTGLTLWQSSQLLCDHMLHQGYERLTEIQKEQGSLRIIELGAGLGLNGILAYQLMMDEWNNSTTTTCNSTPTPSPSLEVVLTDGDTNALSVLRNNVENNVDQTNPTANIAVEQLLWGKSSTQAFLKRHDDNPFDLILASDAIYVKENVIPLMSTVQVLLKHHPHAEFWFSYCCRRQVSVQIDNVLSAAENVGLSYKQVGKENDLLAFVFQWEEPQSLCSSQ